jgi:hypothetical protein
MPGTPTGRHARKRKRTNCMYRYKHTASASSELTSRHNYKYVQEQRSVETSSGIAYGSVMWVYRQPDNSVIGDLNKAVRLACTAYCEQNHGGSYTIVYATAWRLDFSLIQPSSAAAWSHHTMKWSACLIAFKTRWGLLYTADKAAQWGTPYAGITIARGHNNRALCPLCHRPDSNTQMMGGCEDNPYMKGLYIKRHDKAVLMLAETIAAASLGQSTIFVDAGRNDELPEFIFGKGSSFKQFIQKLAPVCVPWDKYTLTALDIVVLPNVAPGQFVQMLNKKQRLQINQEVILIEVGYCNDTLQLNNCNRAETSSTYWISSGIINGGFSGGLCQRRSLYPTWFWWYCISQSTRSIVFLSSSFCHCAESIISLKCSCYFFLSQYLSNAR